MEPFLKWAGGKRWLVRRIVNELPRFSTYAEPFVGSGGLFFALEPQRAILADINKELMNCYGCVRDRRGAVVRVLSKLQVNRTTYYRIRDKLYHHAEREERAAFFIYLNRTCWNGLYRENRAGHFNVPMGGREGRMVVYDPEHLAAASRLLKRAELRCCDFELATEDVRRGDLVYFDPPYVSSHLRNGFIKYNAKLFHHADELRLARLSRELALSGVSVLISNSPHPLIKQMYDGPFYKTEVARASCIAADSENRAKVVELVITTFPLSGSGQHTRQGAS